MLAKTNVCYAINTMMFFNNFFFFNRLIRIYQKLQRAIEALEYFTTRGWNFDSTNVIALSQELRGIDQKVNFENIIFFY